MKRKALLVLLPTLILTACAPEVNSNTTSSSSSTPSVSEPSSSETSSEVKQDKPSYDVPTEPLSGYYQSIDISKTGMDLLSEVRELTVSKHEYYTSYGQCRGKDASGGRYHETDYDPNKKSHLIMFYSHASIGAMWNSGATYNREHVWPQSLSNNNWGTDGGGSDLHHIRPCFKEVNSSRGNDLYGEVGSHGRPKTHSYNGKTYEVGYSSGGVWEPMDNVKGDVARIILYDFIHYNNPSNLERNSGLSGSITSNAVSPTSSNSLPITNVIDGSRNEAFEMLKRWNRLDPVDELELNRNAGVEWVQGNRNPFIDHPWLVDAIW